MQFATIIPMNKEICLATNNPGKLKEYRDILAPMGYVIYSPKDLAIESDPEETGKDYRENAYIKAKALAEKVPFPVLSDDSGLEINALGGFPGLFSARFQKDCGSREKAWEELLNRLKEKEDRSASFVCCICYLENKQAKPLYFEGICPGKILDKPMGQNGFGYDPIFYSDEAGIGLGLLEEEEKNRISHRGKAIKKLQLFLAI